MCGCHECKNDAHLIFCFKKFVKIYFHNIYFYIYLCEILQNSLKK